MVFLQAMFAMGGASILFPLVMIFVAKEKRVVGRIFESLFMVLWVWVFVYLGLSNSLAHGWLFTVRAQLWYLVVAGALDWTLSFMLEKYGFGINTNEIVVHNIVTWVNVLFLIITFLLNAFVIAGNVKTNVNTTIDVATYSTTAKAPIPSVSGDKKELPVVNNNKTVSSQTANSFNQVPHLEMYDLEHMRVQKYQGRLVYVAPTDFSGGYFRYKKAKHVNGYFLVDATQKNASPKFIKKKMYYTPNAFLSHDIERNMYKATIMRGLSIYNDPQLEIDDTGKPYFVSSAIGYRFGGLLEDYSTVHVVTVDAVTGETKVYKAKDKPKWLDVAVAPSLAKQALHDYGKYHNGFWNQTGMFNSTQSGVMDIVGDVGTEADDCLTPIMKNGKMYYFATLTSPRSRQTSVLAYAFIDTTTGKISIYHEKDSIMTPDKAMKFAKNQKRAEKWKPSAPMLYRVDGRQTWVVSLLDSNDAFKNYVYVAADGNGNSGTIASGISANDTLDNYRSLLNGSSTTASSTDVGKQVTKSGRIYRVARFSNDSVRFMLKGSKDVYSVPLSKFPEAVFLQQDDKVELSGKLHSSYVVVNNLEIKK